MSRPNPTVLFGFFVALIVAMCGVSILTGGLYLSKHEGDTLHLMQTVLRMANGEWPHLDFMSPLGILGFAPIAIFVKLGFGMGMAIILAQTLVITLLLPALWWVAYSRMQGKLAYLFGFIVIVLVASLVHGEAESSISISMHYNRWAWAVAFVAIALAVLPSRVAPRQTVDGVILSLAMAVLLLMKVTYFAAFILPIVLALILYRNYRTIGVAMASGLFVLLMVTVLAGFDFWVSYIRDLLLVTLGDVRAVPGESLQAVISSPAYVGASLTLIAGVILLRQSGRSFGGLLLLTLAPGFVYVTYQNYGNDPQWLLLLAVLLLAFLPEKDRKNGFGWDLRVSVIVTAAFALAMTTPSFFNLAYSPFRNYRVKTDAYMPMISYMPEHSDLQVSKLRGFRVDGRIAMDRQGSGLEVYAEISERDAVTMLKGEALPVCSLALGLTAWFEGIVDDLDAAGLADGKRVFAADIISSHWLFGPLLPIEHGAVWYYGGLPGLVSADYVLVPLCPISMEIRDQIIQTIKDRGVTLTEIRRTELYILYTHDKT